MPDYPGLGLPLRYSSEKAYGHYPIGAHGSCRGAKSDVLPVRELAMMSIMDRLTDKEEWHKKVFDDAIVSKWRQEALSIPDEHFWMLAIGGKSQWWNEKGELTVRDDYSSSRSEPLKGVMSTTSFDCCIEELRSKAKYYEKSGLIPTLDACASAVKADNLVSAELCKSLRSAFETLKQEQSSAPDWHPNSNEMVQDLVHPSMYPLVYGRSRVLKDEVVGVDDAVDKWAGKGDIIPKNETNIPQGNRYRYGVGSGEVPPQYWSDSYQWLPSNVAFQDDDSVKFTSYINNLHPKKFPQIYHTIERLIEAALPAWDQCLAVTDGYDTKDGSGRVKSRFPHPDHPDDENNENWIPSDAQEVANVEVDWEGVTGRFEFDPEYDDETEKKWELLRKPVIPEPSFQDVKYDTAPKKRLAQKFRDSGLQVIVKMVSIELTPDKPEFPAGGWHVEGQMNEHICGTALYYLDSVNVSPSNLSFRMQTSAYLNDEIKVGQDAYHWLEQVYGTSLGGNSPCLQNYGSIETRQGRLLAFPNVFQHRVSSFRLDDATKPGHRRFIALWLVDPTQRVISTANVPPQQMDWWLDSAFGNTASLREAAVAKLPNELVTLMNEKGLLTKVSAAHNSKIPPELMEMVREAFNADKDALPMSSEEANDHRLKLMKARSAFVKTAEAGWQQHSYSFCEH